MAGGGSEDGEGEKEISEPGHAHRRPPTRVSPPAEVVSCVAVLRPYFFSFLKFNQGILEFICFKIQVRQEQRTVGAGTLRRWMGAKMQQFAKTLCQLWQRNFQQSREVLQQEKKENSPPEKSHYFNHDSKRLSKRRQQDYLEFNVPLMMAILFSKTLLQ